MKRAIRGAASFLRLGLEMCRGAGMHLRQDMHPLAGLLSRLIEQCRLLVANGITAEDYYLFGLHRQTLSWQKKHEFLGRFEKWRWQSAFNPVSYRFFTQDKIVFKRFLQAAGVTVPRLVATVGPHGRAETGEPLRTDDEVRQWFCSKSVDNVVLKPVLGSHGAGVLVLGERLSEAPEWERVPGGRADLQDVLAHIRGFPHGPEFMIEDRLRPHPQLATFSPHVLHTARVVTMLHSGVDVFAAELRIGTGRSPVDNFSQGNLAAPIDAKSGCLGPAAYITTAGVARVTAHPVTGARIEGVRVPDWDEGVALVGRAAQAAPFNPLLGWDLALTSGGPVILEANDLWDFEGIQVACDAGLLGTSLRRHLEEVRRSVAAHGEPRPSSGARGGGR